MGEVAEVCASYIAGIHVDSEGNKQKENKVLKRKILFHRAVITPGTPYGEDNSSERQNNKRADKQHEFFQSDG